MMLLKNSWKYSAIIWHFSVENPLNQFLKMESNILNINYKNNNTEFRKWLTQNSAFFRKTEEKQEIYS